MNETEWRKASTAAFLALVAVSGDGDSGFGFDDAYQEFLKPLRKADLARLVVDIGRWFVDHLAADRYTDRGDDEDDLSLEDALNWVAGEMRAMAADFAEDAQP